LIYTQVARGYADRTLPTSSTGLWKKLRSSITAKAKQPILSLVNVQPQLKSQTISSTSANAGQLRKQFWCLILDAFIGNDIWLKPAKIWPLVKKRVFQNRR